MVLESAADLAGFFSTDAHGVSATITINGTASTIDVILNKEFFAIDPGVAVEIDGTTPVVTGASSDMSGVDNLDTISISGITYNIVNVMPDGTGVTQLTLEEQ